MHNLLRIKVHPRKFEFAPPCPEVMAAIEYFFIAVDWNGNNDWDSITVRNFAREDGTSVPTVADVTINRPDPVGRIEFTTPEFGAQFFCKYELVYQPAGGGAPYVIDPTLIIRPVG